MLRCVYIANIRYFSATIDLESTKGNLYDARLYYILKYMFSKRSIET